MQENKKTNETNKLVGVLFIGAAVAALFSGDLYQAVIMLGIGYIIFNTKENKED